MLNHRIMTHLQKLAGEIGPRYGGSPGNHRAAAYIAQVFADAGLQVEPQRFACPNWAENSTKLTLNNQPLPAVANAFSPPCDVTARAVPISTRQEAFNANLTGKIAILHGQLTQSPLPPKTWFLLSDEQRQLIELLETKQPAALITVQSRFGDLERLIEDADFLLPSATVNAATGLKLLNAPNLPIRLQIETTTAPGYSENMVGTLPGQTSNKIVLCAHYDTKVDTPGAFDNGSGTAVLMALARQFSQHPPKCTLEFVAFSNEEYLPNGDDEYVRCGENSFHQIIAVLNIDGVGQTLGTNSIAQFASSESFAEMMQTIIQDFPGFTAVDPWPASNHYTFFSRGIPALAFSSVGHIHNIHLRSDTIDKLNPTRLAEAAAFATTVVNQLQDKSPNWTRT
ncbi:M28 family peptidase [Candidatus Leptofilum sp.]|uniref:M28 family metallopeptidase n=1 Tax=Candidatus Leptofilum sp. TaxID=3241576 RepID=UPI003B5A1AB2